MTFTEPIATLLAAFITIPPGIWLTLRTKSAKRDALEKLVASITETVDQNYRAQITRSDKNHREQVEWLQSQILYYQKMSAPTKRQRPDHPPAQPPPP